MVNRTGAWNEAATVWPTSTLREMTMPSIGAVMTVWSRFTSFWFSVAWACVTCARLDCSCALAALSVSSAASSSCFGISERASSCWVRWSFVSASSTDTRSRSRVGLGTEEVRAGLLDLRLEQRRVQPRDHLALADDGIEIGEQLLDRARHLGTDLHGRHRLEGAGRADRVHDVAAREGRRGHLGRLLLVPVAVVRAARDAAQDKDHEGRDECLLHAVR